MEKKEFLIALKPTSFQTVVGPNETCSPSKKFSPMIITDVPPCVQPSLGHIAFITGFVADVMSDESDISSKKLINYLINLIKQ